MEPIWTIYHNYSQSKQAYENATMDTYVLDKGPLMLGMKVYLFGKEETATFGMIFLVLLQKSMANLH